MPIKLRRDPPGETGSNIPKQAETSNMDGTKHAPYYAYGYHGLEHPQVNECTETQVLTSSFTYKK